jgi:hypothetical protein
VLAQVISFRPPAWSPPQILDALYISYDLAVVSAALGLILF